MLHSISDENRTQLPSSNFTTMLSESRSTWTIFITRIRDSQSDAGHLSVLCHIKPSSEWRAVFEAVPEKLKYEVRHRFNLLADLCPENMNLELIQPQRPVGFETNASTPSPYITLS